MFREHISQNMKRPLRVGFCKKLPSMHETPPPWNETPLTLFCEILALGVANMVTIWKCFNKIVGHS